MKLSVYFKPEKVVDDEGRADIDKTNKHLLSSLIWGVTEEAKAERERCTTLKIKLRFFPFINKLPNIKKIEIILEQPEQMNAKREFNASAMPNLKNIIIEASKPKHCQQDCPSFVGEFTALEEIILAGPKYYSPRN